MCFSVYLGIKFFCLIYILQILLFGEKICLLILFMYLSSHPSVLSSGKFLIFMFKHINCFPLLFLGLFLEKLLTLKE